MTRPVPQQRVHRTHPPAEIPHPDLAQLIRLREARASVRVADRARRERDLAGVRRGRATADLGHPRRTPMHGRHQAGRPVLGAWPARPRTERPPPDLARLRTPPRPGTRRTALLRPAPPSFGPPRRPPRVRPRGPGGTPRAGLAPGPCERPPGLIRVTVAAGATATTAPSANHHDVSTPPDGVPVRIPGRGRRTLDRHTSSYPVTGQVSSPTTGTCEGALGSFAPYARRTARPPLRTLGTSATRPRSPPTGRPSTEVQAP